MNKPGPDWQSTHWSLLARLSNWDDHESWREFFETYWKLIYSVALRSGLTDSEAQDVVQETILSVAKSIQRFKCDPARGSFKSWLLNLTRWRILNQVKRRLPVRGASSASNRLGETGQVEDDETRTGTVNRLVDPTSLNLDEVWDREWEQNFDEAARQAVQRQVSARQFQIFELSVVQGWPVREVARMLSVNAGQVYLARHRVGRLLKRERMRLQVRLADGERLL